MAKLFSVASWNVEHFKNDRSRVERVIGFLSDQDADIFALYEVEGAEIFEALVSQMPDYTFQITEGPQTQEILIGVRKTVTAFITQKTQFRSGTTHMRPGQLVAVTIEGRHYALLFLHLSSGANPRGMGLRDDMAIRAFDFRKVLNKAATDGETARYIFLGDLNTMGMDYPFGRSIDAAIELRKWDKYGARKSINMRRLAKTHAHSWSNGSASEIEPSNLDHVYTSENLSFLPFTAQDGGLAEVALRGWPELGSPADRDRWIADFSDHALLYFEVHG